MKILMNIEWHNPWAFLGIPIIAIIAYLWRRAQKNKRRVAIPGPVDSVNYSSWRTLLLPYLPIPLFMALFLAMIAMANPQRPNVLQNISSEGIDIFIVMDLSYSMLEKDFEPNRISVAKDAAAKFIKQRPHDRIGLVPFGRTAFTQCPLTMDHKVVLELLDDMKVNMVGPNTAIGAGIATAVNRLENSDALSKVIILFTDGVNNVFEVDPITAAQLAAQFNIKIYTIGMTKVNPMAGFPGGEKLDVHEDNLKEIAELTGGQYFRATSRKVLENIYNSIDRLEKTEMELTLIQRNSPEYRNFLFPALILLLIWFLAAHSFLKTFIP